MEVDNNKTDKSLKSLPGLYSVRIPITTEGLLIKVGSPIKHWAHLMPNLFCTFQGYRKFSDGTTGVAESQQLIHAIGDWIVQIEEKSTENMSMEDVLQCLNIEVANRKKVNILDLEVTFLSCRVTRDEAFKAKERNRKQRMRSKMSDEKKEEIRRKERERYQNLTEEEKEKRRENVREHLEKHRRNLTEEEKAQRRKTSREYQEKKRRNQSEKDKEERRETMRKYQEEYRRNQRIIDSTQQVMVSHNPILSLFSDNIELIDLIGGIKVANSVQHCAERLQRTMLTPNEDGHTTHYPVHQSLVCVVCDHFIIGTESFHWIESKVLNYHENILSSSYHYKESINPLLKSQYKIDNPELSNLLLSPRARRSKDQNAYMCCQICYEQLSECKQIKSPPKLAISNGFAIGYLPEEVCRGVTPLVNNLVAPVRAFNYFVSFNCGKEQKITGNFTFFSQDVPENIGALQHTRLQNNNPSVYIILSGSFSPPQLDKIRKQGCYSVETFEKIYTFLHSNNKHYKNFPTVNHVPKPVVEEIYINETNNSDSFDANHDIDGHICWKYWFPNIEDPDRLNGSFCSQSEFAKALWVGETPTLIYHPSKVVNQALLSQLCPIAFPFGVGDLNEKRKPFVNEIECLQHYLKISLPQFQEGQIVLIIHHMYQRRKSFLSGITKCNISSNGNTIGEQLTDISAAELDDIITEMKKAHKDKNETGNITTSNNISQFLRCIRTSCVPIGYSNEAAADARNKMFALWMTFGPPSLLFTFSPCDECSFKMHLYATGKQVALPNMRDCSEIMSSDLSLRKSLRVQYPGACARQFDCLLQVVISDLLGWQNGKHNSNLGIFGRISAWAAGVEEQGRTSLHAHIILWIHNYHALQLRLFSADKSVRDQAIEDLKKYLQQVLSSSFVFDEKDMSQSLHDLSGSANACTGQIEQVPLQHLRDMRHIQYRKHHQGKILKCTECLMNWDTTEVINGVIKSLHARTKEEVKDFWPEDISFPLKEEQIEIIALRYQYDMLGLPSEAKTLRQLLQLVVMIFFNTHDWRHRKSCFKKGNECRFHLPQMPCDEISLKYNAENIEDVVSGKTSEASSKWYLLDGRYLNVCSFDILPKRNLWDVFVNTHNPHVSNLFGYNNNVAMGSINTLYYCTLYASKSTQEEETYPYLRACEALSSRIKKISDNGSEDGLSSRQIGLRRLLSGINAHLSSCVVSATMAWYLVTHGSRFHFSHEFKPLLLSQYEAWHEGTDYSRRIRYKKRQRQSENDNIANSPRSPLEFNEQSSEVWFDSDVNNYIFRPDHPTFQYMSVWEYNAKYDMRPVRPKCYLAEHQENDENEKYFRFSRDHSGYQYSCLVRRECECIPKLYYSNKFPDISSLQLDRDEDVEDAVKQLRELYALKAMLLFYPFTEKQDLYGGHTSLWDYFQKQKEKLVNTSGQTISQPSLYIHSIQILQNIQDMLNVKKVPCSTDVLLSCTDIHECEQVNTSEWQGHDSEMDLHILESHIDLLAQYVGDLSRECSTFNSSQSAFHMRELNNLKDSIISIQPTNLDEHSIHEQMETLTSEDNIFCDSPLTRVFQQRTIITIITHAIDANDIQLPLHQNINNLSSVLNMIDFSSLDTFALKNNLDLKQAVAFDAICSSFMLSFLNECNLNISLEERQQCKALLQRRGATDQLLMCVTGPGGSGKSHVIKCCRMYCKSFCNALGKPFDFSVFPVTATSNSAASLIQGKTIHLAAMLRKSKIGIELSSEVDWTVTKVLIIDEISLAGIELFPKLDKHLRILTGNRHLLYGGIHVVFTGDFMQLPPVGGTPIFSRFNDIHWHGSLNAAIFLDQGNHRFRKDPEWGEILKRIQLGKPTPNDLAMINRRLISLVELPSNMDCSETRIVYGCYTNKRRNTITNACFLNYVMHNNPKMESDIQPPNTTILIKGLLSKENKDVGPDFHKFLWSMCGDDNLDAKDNSKFDPCLKLIKGSPLMINSNAEKDRKLVKGTLGNFVGVKWKNGCGPHIEDYFGHKVYAANVADLESIIMMLESDKRIVDLKPETNSVDIKLPGYGAKNKLKDFKILQFPINLSLATTGHKLQGMTKDILILAELSDKPNWLYVVLSRVTTLAGLFLMVPLTMEMFKPISQALQHELDFLRELENQFISRLNH